MAVFKGYSSKKLRILFISLVIMTISEMFFILDVIEDTMGIGNPFLVLLNHALMETFATLALGVAIVVTINHIRMLLEHQRRVEESMQVAAGQLHDVIHEYFTQWGLTPSEKEVAMMLFKGCAIQEIADLRETKIGTVKNQSSSIYQKAGVKNRSELFALFVEELLSSDG